MEDPYLQEVQEQLSISKETIGAYVNSIKKENERWSGWLMNLKADKLMQENELHQIIKEKASFL